MFLMIKNLILLMRRRWKIVICSFFSLTIIYFFSGCSMRDVFEESFTVGQDPRWKDFHLNGKERNLAAFNDELLKSISKDESFKIRLSSTLNPLQDLIKGEFQGILSKMQMSDLNEHLLFSDPYFLIGPVLILHSRDNTESENERVRKVIAIPENSPLLSSLEQDPYVEVKIYDDFLTALRDLRGNQIDGAIFPVINAYLYTEVFYKNELKIASLPLTDDGIRLVALKNEQGKSLIEKFNAGLKRIKEDGSYRDLLKSWGFIDVEEMFQSKNGGQ